MLDIKIIREHPEEIEKAATAKRVSIDVQKILTADSQLREVETKAQKIREKQNLLTKDIHGKPTEEQIEDGRRLKEELQGLEDTIRSESEELQKLLLQIPNPPKPDVKVGKDDSENDVVKTVGEPTKFSFTPKDHLELGEKLGMIDMERAAKVSGARFAYLKGDGVLLELALVQFALKTLLTEGFTPVIPPVLIKRETMQGLGYMENGGEEDMFQLRDDEMFLIGTAEQALVPQHMNETLQKKELPRRYVGFSPSFRREAGSYGKDTRGILRVHQFDKVEMVSFVPQGEDDAEHEYLLNLEEKFFQALAIPYQVIKMCSGDLGFPAARKYDIEAWMPAQDKYREVTSVSTVTDFQSRRLNMRYEDVIHSGGSGSPDVFTPVKKYLNVLNGTAFAIGRTLIAIMENYQQEDGSIRVPKVLQAYVGKEVISSQ
jgi:seryl-tRNA synthetase